MKKVFISAFLITVFTFYVIFQRLSLSSSAPQETAVVNDNTSPASIQSGSSTPVSVVTPPPQQSNTGFKNGDYTGDTVDAYYGNVQVKVIISGGRITDVQFLQYPSDRRTSVMINTQAMPYLKQEAIAAQSANVDVVSGASATSQAFIQSLQSALAQAK